MGPDLLTPNRVNVHADIYIVLYNVRRTERTLGGKTILDYCSQKSDPNPLTVIVQTYFLFSMSCKTATEKKVI